MTSAPNSIEETAKNIARVMRLVNESLPTAEEMARSIMESSKRMNNAASSVEKLSENYQKTISENGEEGNGAASD